MDSISVHQIAQRIGGEVRGNGDLLVDGAAAFDKAGPSSITFVGDEKHLRLLKDCRAGACFLPHAYSEAPTVLAASIPALVFVDDAMDAFLAILREFRPQRPRPNVGISPAAHIDPTAVIGPDCNIYAGAIIGPGVTIGSRCDIHAGVCLGQDCRIGDDCILYPYVVMYPDVVLEPRVIVHASAVLGADGFGFRFRNGRFEKIPQLGSVHIHSDCEVGASTTIDRGMIGPTVIGEGTKLDNLIMIGHNCELGRHNAFASQVGLAGSVTTGDYVRCAGQVGIADHLHLGEGSVLGARAGVHRNVPAGETHIGTPARPEQEQIRTVMSLSKVPEMRKKMQKLEAQVLELQRQVQELLESRAAPEAA